MGARQRGALVASGERGGRDAEIQLLAAGRADLAAAVESNGGWLWLSLGWSSNDAQPSSGPGVHPDYPPEVRASGLAPTAFNHVVATYKELQDNKGHQALHIHL
ncbi:protein FLOURY ENDOSPERM 6, chloroplastic-like [Triticum dicoccoides]|uniref:protein FLOURY ENDOSPERM 6, chloroplastic-like n=1 Tax=Triticum dicoccoides TaxID=85692 RepID=UPI00188F8B63|nr:protein FLOURY ENDOSPERM 6, chloroplastic-like [Triticum dicoccoides]